MLRLDGDALPDPARVDFFADRRDPARQFVAEDHRLVDDKVADAAVAVVVHIGPAHPDGGDLDEHLLGAGDGTGRSSMLRLPTPVITLARMVSEGMTRSCRYRGTWRQNPRLTTPASSHS